MPIWGIQAVQPPLGTPINWSNPITQGLAWVAPINEGTGNANGYMGNGAFAPVLTGTPSWVSGPQGLGLSCSNTAYNSYGNGSALGLPNPGSTPFSTLWYGSVTSVTTRTDVFGQWLSAYYGFLISANVFANGKFSLYASSS